MHGVTTISLDDIFKLREVAEFLVAETPLAVREVFEFTVQVTERRRVGSDHVRTGQSVACRDESDGVKPRRPDGRLEWGVVVFVLVHVLHLISLRGHHRSTLTAGADDFDIFETSDALGESAFDGLHRHRGDATARTGTADRDGRGPFFLIDVSNLEVTTVLLDLRDVVVQIVTRLTFESLGELSAFD